MTLGIINAMSCSGHSLEKIVKACSHLKQVRKANLQFGDLLVINTLNSEYTIYALDKGYYLVFGGWFEREGLSPMKTTINGCTWGSSIIKTDIVAACNLCLEFGNRVVTSPIQKISLVRCGSQN